MELDKVSVIGLGYIGLPTAAIIASRGLTVIGVEIDQDTVETINAGKIHIVEPNLDILVRSVVSSGNLRAVTKAEPADVFIVAVPTPFIHSDDDSHQPDISYIESTTKTIAPVLEKGNLVILESTSPVGTIEKLAAWLARARPDLSFPQDKGNAADINIAYCPERVLPGHVLQELISNDRVIGGMSNVCSAKAVELYRTFVRGECIVTNSRTAEMAKLTENSFRDMNIAFANELSIICDKLKINVWELIKLSNRHPRVNILNPGPGVGGHCIAVDPWFIIDSCPKEAKLIKQARLINDHKPHYVVDQIIRAADEFKRPIIACLGLAFKADIDDLRGSPALQIVEFLANKRVGLLLTVEPNIRSLPPHLSNSDIELTSLETALAVANVVVILVDHQEFKAADKAQFSKKIVIDTRGIL